MSLENDQLSFYDLPQKNEVIRTPKKKPFESIRALMIGADEQSLTDFQPEYNEEFGISDESASPEDKILAQRAAFIDEIVNYYEISLNDHLNEPKARATKRAKLEGYRSLQKIDEQDHFFNELDKEVRAQFKQLVDDYFNTRSETEKKSIRHQARQLIDQFYQGPEEE